MDAWKTRSNNRQQLAISLICLIAGAVLAVSLHDYGPSGSNRQAGFLLRALVLLADEGREIEGMTPDRGVGYLAALPVLLGGDGFTHARRVRESWPPDEYVKQWWAWDPMFTASGRE